MPTICLGFCFVADMLTGLPRTPSASKNMGVQVWPLPSARTRRPAAAAAATAAATSPVVRGTSSLPRRAGATEPPQFCAQAAPGMGKLVLGLVPTALTPMVLPLPAPSVMQHQQLAQARGAPLSCPPLCAEAPQKDVYQGKSVRELQKLIDMCEQIYEPVLLA